MARRNKKENTSSLLGLILLAVLVVVIFSFNYRIYRERDGNQEEIENLQAELEEVKERRTDLETSLDRTEDREHIERVLREDFLMKKPGEEKVVILTEEEEEETEEVEEEEETRFDKFKSLIPFVD